MRDAACMVRSGRHEAAANSGALAWLPLAGAALGLLAAGIAIALGRWSSVLGGAAGLGVLRVLEGPRASRLWLGLLALETVVLVRAPVATQAVALVLAPALGAWSRVVQCHGGRPASGSERHPLVGRATFREFGLASVLAIGGALAAFDALGLVAVLAAVIPTLLLRATFHARLDGMPAWGPVASARIAEAVVIVVLALASSGRSPR
jgi:hypothetical protein